MQKYGFSVADFFKSKHAELQRIQFTLEHTAGGKIKPNDCSLFAMLLAMSEVPDTIE